MVLTSPQKHTVTLEGASVGTLEHLPPTPTAQYHFRPGALFNPYVSGGVSYTMPSGVDLLNGAGCIEHDSFGLALQVGVGFSIESRWLIDAHLKKVQLRADVLTGGVQTSLAKVDPVLLAWS